MSRVDSFVLFAPGASEPPPLPWASEFEVDAAAPSVVGLRDVPRWVELGGHVYGDGKVLEVGVWGMVTNHRDGNAVINAFMAHDFGPHSSNAVLLVHRDGAERAEVYYRDGNLTLQRRLAAAAKEPCEP